MWQAVKFDSVNGSWSEVCRDSDLNACKNTAKSSTDNIFFFWASEPPADQVAQRKIVEDVIAANGGKVLRGSIGVKVTVEKVGRYSACPGNCYCVVTANSRDCQTQYCNQNWCWWVSCGVGC